MQPKNFSTHAIESLMELRDAMRKDGLQVSGLCAFVELTAGLLHRSVKFLIPDNGRLIGDGNRNAQTKMEMLGLPFPITALEYDAPDLNDDILQGRYPAGKRIALAIEVDKLNEADVAKACLAMPGFKDCMGRGLIAVVSIYTTGESSEEIARGVKKGWLPSSGMLLVDPDIPVITAAEAQAQSMKLPRDIVVDKKKNVLPVHFEPVGYPGITQSARAQIIDDGIHDTGDELNAVLDFCAVMNCKNVSTETIEAPAKLNKKRTQSKKPPFYEYRILMLAPGENHAPGGTQGGSHASPRMHLRRGHIRRLQSGRVTWVNAALVGHSKGGVIDKAYEVRPATRP